MRKRITKLAFNFIILLILGGIQLAFPAKASFSGDEHELLYVGVEEDRYPLVYFDQYTFKLTGFDVEYAEELCKKMHRRCQLVVAPYTELVRMLNDKRLDLMVASLNDTPQHRDNMALSKPYYISHSVLMCRFPLPESIDAYWLKPYVIGNKEGSTQQEDLRNVLKQTEIKNVVSFSSYNNMFKALLDAKIDCMLADSHTGYDLIKHASEEDAQRIYFSASLKFIRSEFNQEKIAVRKSDAEYLERINQVIDEIDQDGTHQRLSLKYFPFTAY